MFIKIGDPNPITIVDPIDVDDAGTKKILKKTIKAIKDQKIIPAQTKKESEKK